ncbi:MAG: chemotaxis protein CheR [Phycisphaerae bacterium]|nr:chemotaxis protein CheR [Phycisphaerae bacterium]
METEVAEVKDLTTKEYELIRRLVYAKSGINLGDKKMQLVRARLGKRVRTGGFRSFREYYNHVENDPTGEELCSLLDAISTNTTHLFREIHHFNLLRKTIKEWINDKSWRARNTTLRIWSAGCSSGEEPHSIVMVAHDALANHSNAQRIDLKVLATDLSVRMLSKAKLGLYETHRVGTVPAEYKNHYLTKVKHDGQVFFQLVPELRRAITFTRFNLMAKTFPFRHGFHVIFCRNVMIYFDQATRITLVNKYAAQLHKGGYLLIGHSESLNGIDHPLSYVEPTVYRKD